MRERFACLAHRVIRVAAPEQFVVFTLFISNFTQLVVLRAARRLLTHVALETRRTLAHLFARAVIPLVRGVIRRFGVGHWRDVIGRAFATFDLGAT